MQFLLRSIGRVGSDLPRLCRCPAALARRGDPLKPLASTHPDLNRLYGSIYNPPQKLTFTKCMEQDKVSDCLQKKDKVSDNLRTEVTKELLEYNPTVDDIQITRIVRNNPPQRLIFTNCMEQDKVSDCLHKKDKVSDNLRTEVTKELMEYNPTVDDIQIARIVRNSSHRDGAIYNNTRLQEDFDEGDLADRNETRLEPMMFSKPTDVCMFPQHMFQFFSVLLSKSPISNGSIQLYGYIAARDVRDGMLNYIVNYSRDNPIVVQQGSLIEMTGPKRGIEMCSIVLIEFDMRIKNGIQEEDDLQLIDGALVCSGCDYEPWKKPIKQRIIGSSGAVDVTSVVLGHAVEATIEVVVSEVQSSLGLSLSSFLNVMDAYEEIQLFDGIIARSGPLRRFVVAVPIYTVMLLKLLVGNDASRHIKFQPKLHGCTRQQIRLKVATVSLKVTWSTV